MTEPITPNVLADAIRRRLASAPCDVSAYWMHVAGDRDAYARALEEELAAEPIVVVVVRDARFTNPNALLSDFVELLAQSKDLCVRRLRDGCRKCAFVLLSRTELTIPQISSPVELPPWFPVGGGTTLEMRIEDLSWTADASLAVAEVRVGALCEALFDLEETLLRRIAGILERDHRRTNALLEIVRRDSTETLSGILATAVNHQAGVTTPEAFRPSLRDGRSFVARLWSVVQERTAEQLKSPSKGLADALDLPEELSGPWHESLVSVMRRPSGGEVPPRLRFARNLLVSIAEACQLITAAAHADAYGHYPVVLLRSCSFDLVRSLADAEVAVAAL